MLPKNSEICIYGPTVMKEYLNDKGIAVVLSGVSNDNEQGYVVSVDPVVGARYTQEGSDSVVTLFYE